MILFIAMYKCSNLSTECKDANDKVIGTFKSLKEQFSETSKLFMQKYSYQISNFSI